jgi:glycosyltransferase involved in cell wall biosynthesis
MKILVIIPAYNEQDSIKRVIEKIREDYPEADFVVINDCSKDDTLKVLIDNNITYIDLPLNLGIGGCVQTGYRYALQNEYEIAIQIDGDGQHDTAYLKDVIEPLINGQADIVIGSRFIDKQGFQSSGMRRMGIKFLSMLIRCVCGTGISDVTSGFRAVNKRFIKVYAEEYPVDYPEPEAIVKASVEGARIAEVPVVMKERENGVSSISFWKSCYYMIKVSLAIILCRMSNDRKRK